MSLISNTTNNGTWTTWYYCNKCSQWAAGVHLCTESGSPELNRYPSVTSPKTTEVTIRKATNGWILVKDGTEYIFTNAEEISAYLCTLEGKQ